MNLTASIAKSQLSKIPADKFLNNGDFTDGVNRCSAIGHLQRINNGKPNVYSIFNCSDMDEYKGTNPIRIASSEFLAKAYPGAFSLYCDSYTVGMPGNINLDIAVIEHFKFGDYQQQTSKERVLALLTDMMEAGY